MLTDPEENDYDTYDIDYVNEIVALGASHTEQLLGSRIHTEPDPQFKPEIQGYSRTKAEKSIDYSDYNQSII